MFAIVIVCIWFCAFIFPFITWLLCVVFWETTLTSKGFKNYIKTITTSTFKLTKLVQKQVINQLVSKNDDAVAELFDGLAGHRPPIPRQQQQR